jgi:hypothetical protein
MTDDYGVNGRHSYPFIVHIGSGDADAQWNASSICHDVSLDT